MRVLIAALAGAAALGMAPELGAQKTPAPKKQTTKVSVPDRDGCVTTEGRTECRFTRREAFDSAMMKRPALGIQLSPTGTARDTLGVFISRVTPKGPAENAGVVEGDRIAAINGVDLRVNAADAGDDYASDLPSRRLSREVAKLAPGNIATLRVNSGGRVRDVRVTVGRASDLQERGRFGMLMEGGPDGRFRMMPGMEGMRMRLRDFPRMRMEDMEMPRMRMEEMELPRIRLEGMGDRMWIERLAPPRDKEKEKEKGDKKKGSSPD